MGNQNMTGVPGFPENRPQILKDPSAFFLIFEKATECRLYDQPKIGRIPVLDKFTQNRYPTDVRLVVQPTFGSLFEDF
jgi:hypothetical protein